MTRNDQWGAATAAPDLARPRSLILFVLAVIALIVLTACGDGESADTDPSPDTGQQPAGTAELDIEGRMETFSLSQCESSDDGSVEASGDTTDYTLELSVSAGEGSVTVTSTSDDSVVVQADVTSMDVSGGSFSGLAAGSETGETDDFAITGACIEP